MSDIISRQAALERFRSWLSVKGYSTGELNMLKAVLCELEAMPSVEPTHVNASNTLKTLDCISRQAAIDALIAELKGKTESYWWDSGLNMYDVESVLKGLPSAQPERTCVNCGRTANNGGWYADGRTRCPIEEHYALPKDGYCHLWEKRNVTDDDYPERREE